MSESQSAAYTAFAAELQEVEQMLTATADELGGPLGELVRGQIYRARPSVRAALVLALAMTEESPTVVDGTSPTQRTARMNLAAALEMLYVALNIHRLLVDAVTGDPGSEDDDLDRAFVGSTILAGDYCFSRAAQLAAHTDHPTVVAVFAQALQTISEGRLRHQFASAEQTGPPSANPEDTVDLLEAGAQAAAVLVNLDAARRAQAIEIAHELAAELVPGSIQPTRPTLPQSLDVGLQMRRQILFRWLAAQASNGYGTSANSNDSPRGRYN